MTNNGKKLTLKVQEPDGIIMKTWNTVPLHSYDADNPGTIMVGFEVKIPAKTRTSLTVVLLPEGTKENSTITMKKLEEWPGVKLNK